MHGVRALLFPFVLSLPPFVRAGNCSLRNMPPSAAQSVSVHSHSQTVRVLVPSTFACVPKLNAIKYAFAQFKTFPLSPSLSPLSLNLWKCKLLNAFYEPAEGTQLDRQRQTEGKGYAHCSLRCEHYSCDIESYQSGNAAKADGTLRVHRVATALFSPRSFAR